MNEMAELAIRRILVALDASAHSLAALEEAASLAAAMEAELMELFVEDINLLRIAALPFARQISYPSGKEESMSSARIDRELKIRGELARKSLEAAAERRHTPWSFRIVRGEVTAEILAAASQADLILLGKAGWSPGRPKGLGSTALALVTGASCALILVQQEIVQQEIPLRGPIMAVYDGSNDSRQALQISVRLAETRQIGLVVLIPADTPEEYDRLRQHAMQLVSNRLSRAHFRRLFDRNLRRLAQALRSEGDGLLVLTSSSPLAQEKAIRILVQEIPNPVLLIRPQ